jgi:general secretion pathway protein M
MSLAQRLERLDPRERRMFRALMIFIVAAFVIAVPIATQAMLKSKSDESETYRTAIDDIITSQPALIKAEQKRQSITNRYARPAPPLSSFIDSLARELTLDVPEIQDRPTAPHGKRYEERAVRLQLRKVDLAKLSNFLEKIEAAGHPIVLSKLNVHKRISEQDSYDVELIVSAYDRKELPKAESTADANKGAGGTGSDKAAGDAQKEEP